jgi:hypothetical protein
MKRSLLARLRSSGALYLSGGLLLLVGVPFYQLFILSPTGFSEVSNQPGGERIVAYLVWIQNHNTSFLIYRALLIAAFALLWTLPFSLYRIIVAQELMGQREHASEDPTENETEAEEQVVATEIVTTASDENATEMPEFAWRGKGFVVLAVWAGIIGLAIYLLSTVAGTLYLFVAGNSFVGGDSGATTAWAGLFTLGTNSVGSGLIGLATLCFGAMIGRAGKNLWPTSWVTFGYAAILAGALLCVSAIAVACTPGTAQSTLTTIATLLYAALVCWLGILLVRLHAE